MVVLTRTDFFTVTVISLLTHGENIRYGKVDREGDRPALINGDLKQWYKHGLIQPILIETVLVNGIRMDVFTEIVIILLMFKRIVLESGTTTDYYIGKGVPLLLIEVVSNGIRME
jgi:hypothetical protein